HPIGFAGELASEKISRLSHTLGAEGTTHSVLTDPASLAWLFNIRGRDVPHTPLALGFVVLCAEGLPKLLPAREKLNTDTEAYLTQLADLLPPESLEAEITRLASQGARIGLDPALAAERLRLLVKENGGTVVPLSDPARLPRAVKNKAELAGSRAAHRRD